MTRTLMALLLVTAPSLAAAQESASTTTAEEAARDLSNEASAAEAPESPEPHDAVEAPAAIEAEPGPAEGPWGEWVLSAGLSMAAHDNAARVFVPLAGATVSLSRALMPFLELRLAYSLHGARPGISGTYTIQLHHYLSLEVVTRAVIHERAALFLGAGGAVVIQHNGHHSPGNQVWAAAALPAFALSGGVDATLPGFGLRFSVDAWLHPDFVDVGGGVHALVPFS